MSMTPRQYQAFADNLYIMTLQINAFADRAGKPELNFGSERLIDALLTDEYEYLLNKVQLMLEFSVELEFFEMCVELKKIADIIIQKHSPKIKNENNQNDNK